MARDVAARPCEGSNEARSDRIGVIRDDDGDSGRGLLGGYGGGMLIGHQHIDGHTNQLGRQVREPFRLRGSESTVPQAPVVNMDETGWRQERRRAWLWTVVTAELTVFQIDRSRGGAVVDALLGADLAGVVGSDRWSAYSRFPAEQRAVCWAHLKRDFQALVDRAGEAEPIGRWGLTEIERLFALWRRFRAGEFDRTELRRRLIPLQARLGRLLRRGRECPDRKAAGLCRELRK